MEEQSKREILINSDWMTTFGVALLLLFSLWRAAYDFRQIANGEFTQPVSIHALLLAFYAFLMAYWSVGRRLLRGGFFLLGAGASIRIVVYCLHASDHAQYLAAINALVFGIAAWTMILICAVQWFRSVVRVRKDQ
jgi:hypothetical protein